MKMHAYKDFGAGRLFPVNFLKFLKTVFSQNTPGDWLWKKVLISKDQWKSKEKNNLKFRKSQVKLLNIYFTIFEHFLNNCAHCRYLKRVCELDDSVQPPPWNLESYIWYEVETDKNRYMHHSRSFKG